MNDRATNVRGIEGNDCGRRDIALLVRGISDESWHASFRQGADNLMICFRNYGGNGAGREAIKARLWQDIDQAVLLAVVAREFVVRLGTAIQEGAGLSFDLRFKSVELSQGGAMRFVRMTATSEDVKAINRWNVIRMDPRWRISPKPEHDLNEWDSGAYLDSIVRSIGPQQSAFVTLYGNLFRDMGRDGFIERALLVASRHLDMFAQDDGTTSRSLQ